jgi:hypothetical protein
VLSGASAGYVFSAMEEDSEENTHPIDGGGQ